MLAQVLHISDETRGVNYGLDKVRFTNPVRSERRSGLQLPSVTACSARTVA
ncbi:hypothetical protein ACWEWX_11415 [Streptomyces asiaticus]